VTIRQLVRVVHRDVGYFLVGLTIFFCVSGIAVNHIDQWNPNYSTTVTDVDLGPLTGATLDELEKEIVEKAELDPDDVAGRHRPELGVIVVFLPHGGKAEIAMATGKGTIRRVETRPFIFESNVLHLNHLKGLWTWVSDGFAVLLLLLALTGPFILKGKNGLAGRGKWFTAAGLLVPVGFIVYYYAVRT
jgi:hypothetical protein